MSEIIYDNKYPNVIVFTHNDMDGIFSAMAVKYKYDNNLMHSEWDRNVNCYICSYGEKFRDLEWFKSKVEESYISRNEKYCLYDRLCNST
jgi:oligoribonuclease NrnB/cAMP/cGMP phosphodiesterase (DHH superfamily)